MGTGTLLSSLSHAGSLLAMPAPACPALSWRPKGIRMGFLEVGSECIQTTSWDTQLQHKSDWLPNSQSGNLPTSMGTGTLKISMSHAGSNASARLPSPELAPRRNENTLRCFFGSWLKIHSDDIWRHDIAKKDHSGSRTVSLESFLLYGHRNTIHLAVPC